MCNITRTRNGIDALIPELMKLVEGLSLETPG